MDEVPQFTFTPEQLAKIREELDIHNTPADTVEVPSSTDQPVTPIKKKRGRGRPSNAQKAAEAREAAGLPPLEPVESPLPSAKLTKRDEREVAERFVNILVAATGIASQAKPYLQMTDDEAKAIAEPLSSYLVRNADTVVIAQQVLENYDLLAIILGVMAYTVRVYRDRVNEVEQQREYRSDHNADSTTLDRIAEFTNGANSGPETRVNDFVSAPYG